MATRKLVGQVTPEERDEIQMLFERRNGLNELAKIKSGLHLNSINTITNDQLKSLSNVEWLSLNSLRKITLEQAKIITS
jgi:CXXX repeat modification system protein